MIKTNASIFLDTETEVSLERTDLGLYIRLGDEDSVITIHFLATDPVSVKNEVIAGLRQALDAVERTLPAMYLVRDQAAPAIELCQRLGCHHARASHESTAAGPGLGYCNDCQCHDFIDDGYIASLEGPIA